MTVYENTRGEQFRVVGGDTRCIELRRVGGEGGLIKVAIDSFFLHYKKKVEDDPEHS
jgi:hypothetical protein